MNPHTDTEPKSKTIKTTDFASQSINILTLFIWLSVQKAFMLKVSKHVLLKKKKGYIIIPNVKSNWGRR